MAGLKPQEVYDCTLKEILTVVDGYDEDRMNYFNLNTRVVAWHSLAGAVERMPNFETFLKAEQDSNSPQTLADRAALIREQYYKLGLIPRPEA